MDSRYITRCFELAKKGIGKVSPNPLVGCVIVKNGRIIGEGWHEEYGKSHAEINAFNNCITSPEGSTLYSNLEPCSHTNKKTPPCVPEIINRKISKVVISNVDPNPDVNGKGLGQLKQHGITVVPGIMEDEGKELNRFYFKYVENKIPFVTIKIAQTLDGKIADSQGKQSWITGDESGKYVHSLRGIYDTVLIGANTVAVDDPLLTVRNTSGRNPVRIVLDGNQSISSTAKILNQQDNENTWIVTSDVVTNNFKRVLKEKGVKLITLPTSSSNKINLEEVLIEAGKRNISSILVEGGSSIFTQFIDQKLFDELIVLQSPKLFGKGLNSVDLSENVELELVNSEKLGNDLKMVFRKG